MSGPPDGILSVALRYLAAGLSIIPTGEGKKPLVEEWTTFQRERPTPEQVKSWFSSNSRNIAIIGVVVSGNLEILDFDFKAEALAQWYTIVNEQAPGLFQKLVFENSPRGAHVIYRAAIPVPGNTKLARRSIEVKGPGDHEYKEKTLRAQQIGGKWVIVPELIETRGEGGYCLVCPSKGYTMRQGDLCRTPTISAEEREILIGAARECNEFLPEKEIQKGYSPPKQERGDLLPGQDFDSRGDVRGILEKHGWTSKGHGNDGREKWARPGKERGKAHSATLTEGRSSIASAGMDKDQGDHRESRRIVDQIRGRGYRGRDCGPQAGH